MLIANLVVVLIVLICAVYQYQKGTLLKAFVDLVTVIVSSFVAFAYFETVAGFFIGRGGQSRFPALLPWAQPLAFGLLFVVAFAVLQTLTQQLLRVKVEFGKNVEQAGRLICGFLLGLVSSGLLVTVLLMCPLPGKYPYSRFDSSRPDLRNPHKLILNSDGLVTGLFAIASKGSLSGAVSFALVHPDFLDQLYLNRLGVSRKVTTVTSSEVIALPPKRASQEQPVVVWQPGERLTTTDGKPVPQRSGHRLIMVRLGIRQSTPAEAAAFTLSQVRVVAAAERQGRAALPRQGRNLYPVGYIENGLLKVAPLSHTITLTREDYQQKERIKWIDFAFHLPNQYRPVLVQFKQNNMLALPAVLPVDPQIEPTGLQRKKEQRGDRAERNTGR